MTVAIQLAWIGGGATALMVVLWIIQRRTNDAGIVDFGWALCLGAAALFCALTGPGDPARRLILGAVGSAWGLRLSSHLLLDRVLKGPEDGRYQMLRERFGSRIQSMLLGFFLAQAASVVVLSLPFALAAASLRAGPSALDVAALAVWMLGFVGESVADHQLKRFRAEPASRGRVCDVGLWRYSRHPNYFFEWLMWVGFALLATSSPHAVVAWSAPLIMLVLILKVTGIPPTEARALKSRGDAYRRYQQTTSAFIPWFPRRSHEVQQ